ncbi:hypothetical protein [Allobaculum sp. Allo2]|uniref:hypothetical protein n=1 Tax=Allobaculum sp. Allo2 TaxID=2853432 RepID=UPI001F60D5D3|nr:hypothetical protein [Allobaculum sp. Allo2]UNT92585.1 hypothetical protein KWG61_10620 [Allobaculum sp. Allo2]
MDMVHELLENEEFVEALPAYSEYVTFTSQLKQKNSELKAQKEELQKAVDELEILQPKQQLERYQEELDQLKSMKAKAEEEFQEALRQANIGKDVANLEARSSYLQEEIARREKALPISTYRWKACRENSMNCSNAPARKRWKSHLTI